MKREVESKNGGHLEGARSSMKAKYPALSRLTKKIGLIGTIRCAQLELDRLPMWRRTRGALPRVLAFGQSPGVYACAFGDQVLERGKPMPVVSLPGIGIACRLCRLDLGGQGLGPFRPGEQALLMKRDRH